MKTHELTQVSGGLFSRAISDDTAPARARRPALVLAYHNVIPDRAACPGDSALHMPHSEFRRQLDHLQAAYEVVSLDALVGEREQSVRRPRVALTFDGAFRGAVTIAAEELATRRLPATIFVAPDVHGERPFWRDIFGADGDGSRAANGRDGEGVAAAHDGPTAEWAPSVDFGVYGLPGVARPASFDELEDANRMEGIWFGSHSWRHRNLTRVYTRVLAEDLAASLHWLRSRFHRVTPWLAYPYGIWNTNVRRLVEAVGYRGAVTIGASALPNDGLDPFLVPRLSVPAAITIDSFILRTATLLSV